MLFVTTAEAQDATTQPVASRVIRGKVFEPVSRQPLPGATVLLVGSPIAVYSDEHGACVLEGAPLAPVSIEVLVPEYESRVLEVAAAQADVDVPLALAEPEIVTVQCALPMITPKSLRHLWLRWIIGAIAGRRTY
jgi:hypothetical protein